MLIDYLPLALSGLSDMGDHYRELGGNALARRMIGSVQAAKMVGISHTTMYRKFINSGTISV